MSDFNITIEGLDETVAMLEQAPRRIVSRGYRKALQAAADVIADEVRVRTPIKAEDTGGLLAEGELRESLVTDVEIDSQARGGVAEVGFGDNGHVALWLEYGRHVVGHKPELKDTGKVIPAKPFMRPAADASAEAAVDAFAESLKQTVTEEFPQGRVA